MRGMRLVERMLLQINAIYDGQAWHGTPLRRILDDIDDDEANARPIAAAHTIHELLAHIIAWNEIVQQRLTGVEVEATPEMDFPSVAGVTFAESLEHLQRAHSALIDTVARMSDRDFDKKVPGTRYTNDYMLHGLLHHNTYHAAQIALLKKIK